MSLNNLDKYIEGFNDPTAPFNQQDDEVREEETLQARIEELEMEVKKLKYAYNCKRKSVEILVENTQHMESHAYITKILKDLFL
tara:strand:+ start:974 stop:1225 length:252 start_codon:yes stop_codon:yes gene_type:complete